MGMILAALLAPGESRALTEQEICLANWEGLCWGELELSQKFGTLHSPKLSSGSVVPPPRTVSNLRQGPGEGWGGDGCLLLESKGGGGGRPQVEVISSARGGLPGAQARGPSPAGSACCAAVSMEPGFTRCLRAPERPGMRLAPRLYFY